MNVFPQALLSGHGVPRDLRPTLVEYSGDLSRELKAMPRLRQGTVKAVGISTLLTVEGDLEAIAFATADENDNNVVVFFPRRSEYGVWKRANADCSVLAALLKGHSRGPILFAFGMTRIALHLRGNLGISEVRGIELTPYGEREASPGKLVKDHVDPIADVFSVNSVWYPTTEDTKDDPIRLQRLCLRAWLSAVVGSRLDSTGRIADFSKVGTSLLSSKHFDVLYKFIREVEQIDSASSFTRDCDFSQVEERENGEFIVHNNRYKTRIRASENTQVQLFNGNGHVIRGRVKSVEGRRTVVERCSGRGVFVGVHRIKVVGREDAGHAERSRDAFIYDLLRGNCDLNDPAYELIHLIYSPKDNTIKRWPKKVEDAEVKGRLNKNQAIVVKAMTNVQPPIIIVSGPPGSGKTVTISAAVGEWIIGGSSAWLIAQSNVAVRNMAERLSEDLINYKILVSREFYDEWHEHLYSDQVYCSLLRTDEIPSDAEDLEILFDDVHVVLCTLETIANPVILRRNVFRIVPVAHLVINEASQIGIFNLMHLFAHHKTIKKVCFFGDPAQVPPCGKEAAPTLQSIFDVKHFKNHAYFLNVQCKIPEAMGNFISENVYHKKLRSQHEITTPSCVAFVDVTRGEEEEEGKSFCNMSEVQTIVDLVRNYYGKTDYCIITPYDAQRNEIERILKVEDLRWDNVYNVDDCQGNEADYILLSMVRTTCRGPDFLISRNRENVMLTRFRCGLVIVTKRVFMRHQNVRETLIGKLVNHWEKMYGSEVICWKEWTDVATQIPGLLSASSSSSEPPASQHSYASSLSSSPLTSNSSRKSVTLASIFRPRSGIELPPTQRSRTSAGPKSVKSASYSVLSPELSLSPTTFSGGNSDPESGDAPFYDSITTRTSVKPWGVLALNAKKGALRESATLRAGQTPRALAGKGSSSNTNKAARVGLRYIGADRAWYNYDDETRDVILEPEPERDWNAVTGHWRDGHSPAHPILIHHSGRCGWLIAVSSSMGLLTQSGLWTDCVRHGRNQGGMK